LFVSLELVKRIFFNRYFKLSFIKEGCYDVFFSSVFQVQFTIYWAYLEFQTISMFTGGVSFASREEET